MCRVVSPPGCRGLAIPSTAGSAMAVRVLSSERPTVAHQQLRTRGNTDRRQAADGQLRALLGEEAVCPLTGVGLIDEATEEESSVAIATTADVAAHNGVVGWAGVDIDLLALAARLGYVGAILDRGRGDALIVQYLRLRGNK
jgi:hypothetical protein